MYRIRFHGRGGQGLKTASRILGSAFFLAGYEVQDAPRYGAERRGAPIFAYVRASKKTINERGIIQQPDLVVVADDSLMAVPAAGVLAGITSETVFLIYSNTSANTWQQRLNLSNKILVIPVSRESEDPLERRYTGASCAGAAARMTGVIDQKHIEQAITQELASHGLSVIEKNIQHMLAAFALMAPNQGCVKEGSSMSAEHYQNPLWVNVPFENAEIAAPAIRATATSEKAGTGLWRTMRPVIDFDKCNRCWWVCSTFCPDGAILVTKNQYPSINYATCKGCMVCVSQCPPHAIRAISESAAMNMLMEELPA